MNERVQLASEITTRKKVNAAVVVEMRKVVEERNVELEVSQTMLLAKNVG